MFLFHAKTIINRDKNGKNSPEIFQFPWKTSAAPRQHKNITALIGVDALYCKSIAFIADL